MLLLPTKIVKVEARSERKYFLPNTCPKLHHHHEHLCTIIFKCVVMIISSARYATVILMWCGFCSHHRISPVLYTSRQEPLALLL